MSLGLSISTVMTFSCKILLVLPGYKLFKRSTSGVQSNFFCERVVNAWNKLPNNIHFNSLNAVQVC